MRRRHDRGSATVYAATFVGLLTTVGLVGASVAGILVGQRQAASAADLAALAGASALQRGESGCIAAGRIVRANRARLVTCETNGEVLTVEVSRKVRTLFRLRFDAHGRARAGPVG